jgi:hypothetical protein
VTAYPIVLPFIVVGVLRFGAATEGYLIENSLAKLFQIIDLLRIKHKKSNVVKLELLISNHVYSCPSTVPGCGSSSGTTCSSAPGQT